MGKEKVYTCCFLGHRKIEETNELNKKLHAVIENLILNEKVHTFLFGSKSQFDDLCHKIVTELKEKYAFIQRIYVRAEYQHIDDHYRNYLLQHFEDTCFPDKIKNAGRAAYVERNYEMIDKSNFCIFYYDRGYVPPRRKNSCKDVISYQPKSGTKVAYDYARKRKCVIINMADELQ